ncbi:C-Jun-amino-terminal kinase-interacting protein 4-like isoform X2 [Gopherus flavomarginatus]|uniref:C-Jun-amino-terminal kinase-interacting protein 4-like isoform X2 n=1 Tax=Gopherus flavomarginatus TaxID=286002 RepID=UPI0021CBF014|nr:C-Jun-amino-terminal kinase-interacting protein 4-like isoform X2 [Gopherus flavomarginatus]
MEEVFGEEGESATPALGEEMVLGLAAGLYGELERLVGAYGRGAVAGLLPQLVSVLEALEQAGGQIQERDEALELLRDDRLGLLGQYERERSGRKRAEERYMELEDAVEQERKGHKAALSRLDGQSRRLEEKARSYADQLASLEEQKAALLKELSALGQTHSKMVQRYKELKALTVPPPAPPTPWPSGVASAPHWPPLFLPSTSDPGCSEPSKGSAEAPDPAPMEGTPEPQQDGEGPTRNSHPLAQELPLPARDGSPQRCQELAEILSSTPELDPTPDLPASPPTPQRNMESLFAEVSGLSLELLGDVDEGADLQGDAVQTLMMENAELRDTRLVLDTARRHLIARVEELMGERESLREERNGATEALSCCQGRLRETEQDLSRIQQELEEIKKQNSDDAEVEAQTSQRKRFTRAEMARVLTERNLYKERLMELQEAVRRTEMLRASREVQAAQMKKSSFWKFFDRLFSASDSPERVPASPPVSEHRGNGGRAPPAVRYLPRPASPTDTREPPNLSPQQQKRDLYRRIRSHIWKQHGRAPVHGWSPPAIPQVRAEQAEGQDLPMLAQLRLLDQKDPSTKGPPWPAPPSLLWVCSGTHSASEVTVMDAARANLVLAQFVLPNAHVLCAAWLPGHRPPSAESTKLEPEILEDPLAPDPLEPEEEAGTPDTDSDAIGTMDTVWLGTQEGSISIYSAVSDWRRCLRTVQLQDAVHSVVHAQGRAVTALGNGTIAVFHRDAAGRWDLQHPRLLDLGRPRQSIRCALAVGSQVWVGYRNRVYVMEPRSARVQRYFEVTGRPESQVRHMALAGDGVWVSVRLDPTLRLFHAATGQPLQEIDLTPFVHSMFGPNTLGFSLHVSALGCFSQRLWIGTASGTVLTVPFAPEFSGRSEAPPATGTQLGPSPTSTPYCAMESAQASYHGHRDAVRFFVCVPGCLNPSLAGSNESREEGAGQKQPTALVLSGGEGYINLRIGDDTDDQFGDLLVPNPRLRRSERSHLIVWQVQA